jgi:hypothetical protein
VEEEAEEEVELRHARAFLAGRRHNYRAHSVKKKYREKIPANIYFSLSVSGR